MATSDERFIAKLDLPSGFHYCWLHPTVGFFAQLVVRGFPLHLLEVWANWSQSFCTQLYELEGKIHGGEELSKLLVAEALGVLEKYPKPTDEVYVAIFHCGCRRIQDVLYRLGQRKKKCIENWAGSV